MRIIFGSESNKIAQEMLDTFSSVLLWLRCMTSDMEHEFGCDILTKKIGEAARDDTIKYSLRDRYGAICDRLLNTSLSVVKSLGVNEREFRMAIDEVVGDSRIYDGEYDTYTSIYASVDTLELDKGYKRWWKPRE